MTTNDDTIEFKLTVQCCIVCDQPAPFATHKGSKFLSEYAEQSGPICNICLPGALFNPIYSVELDVRLK